MEIPPQEAPPGPGADADADADAEEAPAEAGSPNPASPPADGRLKAAAKRVTFPSDEDIVSGAVEPKDPWRHAQNVTVEEVIGAYRQACQKLNCRQIPKLLRQLQEFTDLEERINCLDLKGEKLDYKTCEALEEVFKRLQFKVVDLEQTNLDEDGASALFDMIEYYESATHLNISFNKHIGTRGWQAAAHMMRKTSCLQYLDARNTPLLDHSAPFVARALRIRSSLAVLHLENASLSGRPLMLLATALKMNMNLRELYLADNKLNGLQDSAQLGNLLKFNCSLQILDLRNNHVLDSGLAYICEGLKEQRKGLVTLVLWNNQLTHTGMAFLGMALVNHSLLRLDLDREPKKEAVKSFIETQKALLAEIQNGCKRNFVLVREREEKEQLQLSASMPEITVTAPQCLEESGDLPATGAQNGAPSSEPGPGPDSDSDSDSDGEEDEEENEEEEDQQDQQREEASNDQSPSVPCPALVPSTDSLGPGDRSPLGSPSSPNEQRISVSSPGRGHKVFVVTRVESPPERPELPIPPAFVSSPPPSPPSPPASPALLPSQATDTQDPESSKPQPQLEPTQAGQPLPNGLKPEFALALPPEPPPGLEAKGGSCSLEHELHLPQDASKLEELLLEASLEAPRDTL
ncbi:protein phosphatase 1 regulatory subunit 37 isoform X2 [Nannospalax galili]|uniref:protein phosphatase 1 regulatory subunit 37 isoform X2 n=1 Tax=Nannospalax galili TaxID=1026970 RepID=UPI00111BCECF|nr:protein phosphatase 1 regulatory subunit 37 isoform X2 [Nannospalax galili]